MLHYRDRQSRIHILTLDRTLATDVYERLRAHPGMESVGLIRPAEGKSEITVADLADLVKETTSSRVLVIDVRRQTKGRLQGVYSDVVRYNRPDFNRYCYSVLIGDGPVGLLDPARHAQVVPPFLADLRVDYSPAAFFTNPFLHYSYDETQYQAVYEHSALPTNVPCRLQRYFKKGNVTVEQICRYWRAADVPENLRESEKIHREKRLRQLCLKIVNDEFPQDADHLIKAMTQEGYSLVGESLRVHRYPFSFPEWVLHLLHKAASAAHT